MKPQVHKVYLIILQGFNILATVKKQRSKQSNKKTEEWLHGSAASDPHTRWGLSGKTGITAKSCPRKRA